MKDKKMQFKKILVSFVLFCSLSEAVFAESAEQKAKPLQTKELMGKLLEQLTALKPYMISEDKFVDPKNYKTIEKHLKEFSELAKQTRHNPQLNSENFKFSTEVLENHIVETERVFRVAKKSYARWMLNSTVGICMSCHDQAPVQDRKFKEFKDHKMFASGFDQAEFLFATRVFDEAYQQYDKIIKNYPQNKYSSEQLDVALKRQMVYFSRIKQSPQLALGKLKEYQDNKKLPQYEQKNITNWIKQFKDWDKQTVLDPKTSTDKQIVEFARKSLETSSSEEKIKPNEAQLVTYLRVSGILYEFLRTHPQSKVTPEVLFWLSVCDRVINNSVFYSFADLYLRECIIKYPSDPIAKKCFKEYENETILGYTGSSGTQLPGEVKRDLEMLRKHVETGGQVEIRGH